MNDYKYAAAVTTAVHEELIRWAGRLLQDAGLEVVDVWGRFPPEGTVRSHLVLFPYRVGPEPKMIENASGGSLMVPREQIYKDSVPDGWADLGGIINGAIQRLYPDSGTVNDRKWAASGSPYPRVVDLPKPMQAWYRHAESIEPEAGWIIRADEHERGRPPSIRWRPGIIITANYIAVTGDPGRGTTERTSDTAPLSLATLSVLATAVQIQRGIKVTLPAPPAPESLMSFLPALADSLEELGGDREELAADLRALTKKLTSPEVSDVEVHPLHDLTNQEFALLTQALQRPLQAVFNLRIRFRFGAGPLFEPTAALRIATHREKNPPVPQRPTPR
jgi:hypothetical protein